MVANSGAAGGAGAAKGAAAAAGTAAGTAVGACSSVGSSAPGLLPLWLGKQPAPQRVAHSNERKALARASGHAPAAAAHVRPTCPLLFLYRCAAGGVQGWWKGMWSAHGPAVEQKFQGAVKAVSKAKLAMPGALCQAWHRCGRAGHARLPPARTFPRACTCPPLTHACGAVLTTPPLQWT